MTPRSRSTIAFLLLVLALSGAWLPAASAGTAVGFDLDDTILFTTPAFDRAFKSGVKRFSREFWEIVNTSDRELSPVKRRTEALIREHQQNGDEIYVITGREPYRQEEVGSFLYDRLGIKPENVIFTGLSPDGASPSGIAPKSKAEVIKSLGITVFYGDSDTDIADARTAGAKGIRILRSERSTYKDRYHPGSLGEEILPDSAE